MIYEKMKLKTSVRVIVIGLVFLSLSLSMIIAVSAVDATVVKVDPASQTVTSGDSFSVNVRVEDVTYMGADGATLNFDPGVMSVTGVTEGDFLKSAGATMPIELIDNTVGTVAFAYALPSGGVTGSGTLATINFDTNPAAAAGEYNLDLTNVELLNGDGNEITGDEISNGMVTIGLEPTATATPTPTPTKPSNGDGGDGGDVPGATPTPTPTATLTPTTTPALVPTTPASTSTPAVTSIPVGAVVVKVCPATQVVTAGQSFSVDVRVEGVTNMGADQACLNFDPGVMQATGIVEGDLLKDCPGGGGGTIPIEDIDNTNGTATFMYSLLEQGVGVNRTGILATINFDTEPAAEGVHSLDLTNVLLLDGDGHEITVDALIDGEVTIQPVPTPMSGTGMMAPIGIILAVALALTISAVRKRRKRGYL